MGETTSAKIKEEVDRADRCLRSYGVTLKALSVNRISKRATSMTRVSWDLL